MIFVFMLALCLIGALEYAARALPGVDKSHNNPLAAKISSILAKRSPQTATTASLMTSTLATHPQTYVSTTVSATNPAAYVSQTTAATMAASPYFSSQILPSTTKPQVISIKTTGAYVSSTLTSKTSTADNSKAATTTTAAAYVSTNLAVTSHTTGQPSGSANPAAYLSTTIISGASGSSASSSKLTPLNVKANSLRLSCDSSLTEDRLFIRSCRFPF